MGLINIKNSDNEYFSWYHVRHSNLVKANPERITKKDEETISKLNYEGIYFPISKKDHSRIKKQNNICINLSCYEYKLTYPVYLLERKSGDRMDLLLISDEYKSHYIYIKDFDRFMFNKTKNKNKNYFCKCCLQCFSSEEILIEHEKDCLVINAKQSVKLKSRFINSKNYSKQLPVPLKIYADIECILKKADIIECDFDSSYT